MEPHALSPIWAHFRVGLACSGWLAGMDPWGWPAFTWQVQLASCQKPWQQAACSLILPTRDLPVSHGAQVKLLSSSVRRVALAAQPTPCINTTYQQVRSMCTWVGQFMGPYI